MSKYLEHLFDAYASRFEQKHPREILMKYLFKCLTSDKNFIACSRFFLVLITP